MSLIESLKKHFDDLPDPRMPKKCDHKLINILMIGICGTLADGNDWQDIETFGESKREWLEQWLDLEQGIPSHDTFERVFNRLDAKELEQRFAAWTTEIFQPAIGEIVAIDGKTLRGTLNKLHLVSAWASGVGISLAQQRVDGKSNEITAIPELLELLTLRGCVVTIDAMGCQKNIAEKIVEQQADYVLAVKANQGNLLQHVQERFALSDDPRFTNHNPSFYTETISTQHGRKERRQCWVLPDQDAAAMGWTDCQTLIRVTCEREQQGTSEQQTRYFISTLPPNPDVLLHCVRAHWGIENSFHWVLDAVFKEDHARTQDENAAQNLAILRRIALNLLKRHPGKGTLKKKRYRAALDDNFLLEVLRS